MDVEGRHAGAGSDRIHDGERLEGKRHLLGGVEQREPLAHYGVHGGRARAERERPAQVDGLRCHGQLDCDDACAEIEHLGGATRAERRQRGPVLDARLLHRRRELERHRRRKQARLRRDRLSCDAELGEAVLPRALGRDEPLAQTAEPWAQELERPLDRRGQHRRERDAQEVECGGQRLRVEVADGDDPRLAGDHERVALVRVQLDLELLLDEPQRVARSAVQLREAAKRQRVLQIAGGTRLPEGASAEQRVHALDRLADAWVGPRGGDLRVQRSGVRAEGLEVERGRGVDPFEECACVCDRKRRLPGRVRVAREEPERLAGLELELAEGADREVRVLRKVGLADRPERVDVRGDAAVERSDDRVGDLGPHALMPGDERVRQPQQRGSYHVVGRERAEPDEMAEDGGAVERSQLGRIHAGVPPHPDTGRDAVCGRSCCRRLLDDRAPLAHAGEAFGRELDALSLPRDPHDVREREARTRELDGHGSGGPVPGRPLGSLAGAEPTGRPCSLHASNPPARSVARVKPSVCRVAAARLDE